MPQALLQIYLLGCLLCKVLFMCIGETNWNILPWQLVLYSHALQLWVIAKHQDSSHKSDQSKYQPTMFVPYIGGGTSPQCHAVFELYRNAWVRSTHTKFYVGTISKRVPTPVDFSAKLYRAIHLVHAWLQAVRHRSQWHLVSIVYITPAPDCL